MKSPRMVSIPLGLNPARNPFLRWVVGPVGLLTALYPVLLFISSNFFAQEKTINDCIFTPQVFDSKKQTLPYYFVCKGHEDLRLYLGRDNRPGIPDLMKVLPGKTVAVTYLDARYIQSSVFSIKDSNQIYEMIPDGRDPLWALIIFPFWLLCIVTSFIVIFFHRTRWYEDFQRGHFYK